MSGKIYLTSDLHFGHDREFIWKPRGFKNIWEMNEEIIKRWNSIVDEEDDVYVLGDLMLGGLNNNEKYIKQLNGMLHIVLGNHDTDRRVEIYSKCHNVVEISYAIKLKYHGYNFFLTHFPCMTGNLEKESLKQMTLNLFGHTHQKSNFYEDRPYMYHVGVDSHNCYPVLLDDIIQEMKDKVKECIDFLDEPNEESAAAGTPIDNTAEIDYTLSARPSISSTVYEPKNYKIDLKAGNVSRCNTCLNEDFCRGKGMADYYGFCTWYKKDPPDGGFYG